MPSIVNIQEFLKLSEQHPILDVRSPAEFEQGHFVGASNLPLFTNDERKIVGTLYKKEGKKIAVLKGLELVGVKLHEYVKRAITLNKTETFLVYCWRGGMRSSSMAWFLETYGFKCITLKGGYKSYRKYVLESFNLSKNIVVLGGKTGTGKTIVLHELKKQGEQIIDLENIAHHKGSSFGALGEPEQLSQEQFENELSFQFSKINFQKTCWIENESRKIGKNVLPLKLWEQMLNANVVTINLPIEERINYLVNEYGNFPKENLIMATNRIAKRLGGLLAKKAIDALQQNDYKTAFEICLVYYDKTYNYGESQRDKQKIIFYEFEKLNAENIANEILKSISAKTNKII